MDLVTAKFNKDTSEFHYFGHEKIEASEFIEKYVENNSLNLYTIPIGNQALIDISKLLDKEYIEYENLIVPKTTLGQIGIKDMRSIIPLDSDFYHGLSSNTLFRYPEFDVYKNEEWLAKLYHHNNWPNTTPKAYKTLLGEEKKGTMVVSQDYYLKYGRKYFHEFTPLLASQLSGYAYAINSDIMEQELISYDGMKKVSIIVVVKNSELLGYRWTSFDIGNNRDGVLIRSTYTDEVIDSFSKYLTEYYIDDCIISVNGFSDNKNKSYITDIDWSPTLIGEYFNLDIIESYLKGIDLMDSLPNGEYEFTEVTRLVLLNKISKME